MVWLALALIFEPANKVKIKLQQQIREEDDIESISGST